MVSREGIQPDPQKIKALTNMPAPKNKRELQAFLGIINYLGKFSPGMAEVKLATMKADIKYDDMDLECIIPITVCKGKITN